MTSAFGKGKELIIRCHPDVGKALRTGARCPDPDRSDDRQAGQGQDEPLDAHRAVRVGRSLMLFDPVLSTLLKPIVSLDRTFSEWTQKPRILHKLVELMALLRSPEGCPWDKEQTRETLKPMLIEEAYEVLEALDGGVPQELCDELGDLLFRLSFRGASPRRKASSMSMTSADLSMRKWFAGTRMFLATRPSRTPKNC